VSPTQGVGFASPWAENSHPFGVKTLESVMRTRWLAVLVLGLAVVVGCKRKPAPPEPAPDTPAPGNTGTPGGGKTTAKNGRGTFTIGKSTTYVTGPLDADGRIDYAAALNERLSKGVTPENNANVLFWKALGPNPADTKIPPGYFEKLGIPAPPATGNYFVGLKRYAEQNPNVGAAEVTDDTLAKFAQRPWTANQQPALNAWLKANEKPLAVVVEATRRTHYFSPFVPEVDDKGSKGLLSVQWPGLFSCRELAAALSVRAMLYAGQGQTEAAWQDLIACHRLGRLVGRAPTLLETLVCIAIEQIACRANVGFLAHTQPDAKRMEGYLRDLRALPPLPDVAEKWNLCERCWSHDTIMQLDHRGVGSVPLFDLDEGYLKHGLSDELFTGIDWNSALERSNKGYDRLVAVLRETDRVTRNQRLKQFVDELLPLREQFIRGRGAAALQNAASPSERGQVFGDVYFALVASGVRKTNDAAERTTQTHDNVLTAYALAWYQRVNGRYPGTLAELAPTYLPKAPVDLFTGKGLIYKLTANGYLLYSVGINEKDDGGRTAEEQAGCDDLVVRMPPW
jgi:hypothetical protein